MFLKPSEITPRVNLAEGRDLQTPLVINALLPASFNLHLTGGTAQAVKITGVLQK